MEYKDCISPFAGILTILLAWSDEASSYVVESVWRDLYTKEQGN
jgi:hypothetical protein